MNIEPTTPTIRNPPEQFIGDVWSGCFMEHIAMLESADDPAETTTWKEHVTEDEFAGIAAV